MQHTRHIGVAALYPPAPQAETQPRNWRGTQPTPVAHLATLIQRHHQVALQLPVRRQVWQREPELRIQDKGRIPPPVPTPWCAKYEVCQDDVLGGGAFAEVFRVKKKVSQEQVAIKVMHRPNFALRGIECQITAEIEAMRVAAKHSKELQEDFYILELLNTAEEGEYVYLMLELCEQGDLLRRLGAEPSHCLPEDDVAVIARQLLIGLQKVHELGFIHRDIKPDNLLLNADHKLRIADFGWCCFRSERPTSLAGTLLYMAPELLKNEPQDVEVDVWSAGMTLFQLLTGRPLLQTNLGPGTTQLSEHDPHRATEIKQKRLVEEIETVCPPSMDCKPVHVSHICWDFVQQTLKVNREDRICIVDALHHPWMMKAAELQRQREAERLEVQVDTPESPRRWPLAAKEHIHVPTPEKPRSFDPQRNLAYSPPVSPEPQGPFMLDRPDPQEPIPESDEAASGSPECKTRLAESFNNSPKDSLVEKEDGVLQAQLHKLATPQRGSGIIPSRKSCPAKLQRESEPDAAPKRLEDLSTQGRDLPNIEEEQGAVSMYSSVKLQAPAFGCLKADPLGGSGRPQNPFARGRFPMDNRLALFSPGAEKGELLTPRNQAQGLVPRLPGAAAMQRKPQVLPAPAGLAQPMPFRYQATPIRPRAPAPGQIFPAPCMQFPPPHMMQVRRVAYGGPRVPFMVYAAPARAGQALR